MAVPRFFLHALVFEPGIRRTLSLTLERVSADAALRDIREGKVEYATDAAQKAKLGTSAIGKKGTSHGHEDGAPAPPAVASAVRRATAILESRIQQMRA